MPDQNLIVPEFRSAEEFSRWWQGPDINRLDSSLQAHLHIKPWLEQLKDIKIQEEPIPPIPKEFGRYLVDKELGQGGMGVVYLALDPALKRQVALKILTDKSPEAVQRFMREAESTAKLKHPNIIQVYEVGGISGNYYFTMEYVEGTSLDALIYEKQLTARRAAEIICDIANALHYAHANNLVHRDIKPSNILIDNQGRTYLTDFGLAKETTGLERALTISGTILGTPDYMAPEQASGDKSLIDQRSDIFSLGATLYQSLTGQLPFKGGDLYQVLEGVIRKDPIPPKRLASSISRDIETICLKCLEKEPVRRYQTAQELADDLRRFLNGEEILARPTGFITRIWRKSKRNRAASFAGAGAVIGLIAMGIWMQTAQSGRITDYRTRARQSFEMKKFEDALTWSKQILELLPADTEAGKLFQESQDMVNRRNEARKAFNRTKSIADADEIIPVLKKALEIDPTFGEAWQELGYIYNSKNDYRNAFKMFTKATEVDSSLVNSYFERAHISKNINKDYDGAVGDFARVIELDPESYMGYFAKGAIEVRNGKYKQGIVDLTRAIELKSDYSNAYYDRGQAYFFRGQKDLALADWSRAIEISPNRTTGYFSRGDLYLTEGKLDLALKDFSRHIELSPQDLPVYCARAMLYSKMGLIDLALADANKSAELQPNNSYVYYMRGEINYGHGRYNNGIADYSRAIELYPKFTEAYAGRAVCYGLLNKLDEAIVDCNRALELDPALAYAYTTRGATYLGKGDITRALKDLDQAIKLDPQRHGAYYQRGYAYCKKNDYEQAIADYTQAIKLAPNEAEYYLQRADAYGVVSKYKQAEIDYTSAIALAPKETIGYRGRGMAYYYSNNTDKALADFNKAIELNPKDAVAYYWSGMTHYQRNNFDSAIVSYTRAIKLDPKSLDAHRERAYSYGRKKMCREAVADGERFIKMTQPNDPQIEEMKRYISVWRTFITKENQSPAK